MSQRKLGLRTNQSIKSVHPSNAFKPEWKLSQRLIQADNLIVRYGTSPPDELECPPLTHHMIGFPLVHRQRQVTHIAEQKYEGPTNIGEFILQPSNYPGFFSWSTPSEYVDFAINPDFLDRIAARTECLNPAQIEVNPILVGRDPHIEYIARSFLAEMHSRALGDRLYRETLGIQLAVHLLRNYCTFPAQFKNYEGGLSRQQLKVVVDYIDAHLENNISLKDLTRISGLGSHYYFCHLFKQSTGITPYQYVIRQKMEQAKQLLKQGDLQLAEIALRCGFSSQSSFNRAFRKYVGTTPKSYQQQI